MTHLDETLKQYAKIVLADVLENTKSFQHNYNYYQNKSSIDHKARKESILKKLEVLEKKQEDIIKQIPNIEDNLKYYEIEKKALEQQAELEKMIDTTLKTKPSFLRATEIFHEINNKEKEIREFNRTINCYKVFCQIHEKIDENYKQIESLIEQLENFNYNEYLKKIEDQVKYEGFGEHNDSPTKSKKKSYVLEIKTCEAIGSAENVLKDYKKFNILENGNFTFDIGDGKDIIKGKISGNKFTMNKLGKSEDLNLFFEGSIIDSKMMICFSNDSNKLNDLFENKEYMIEIGFKLDKYKINYDGNTIYEAWLNKCDEVGNKLIRNGFCTKDDNIYLILGDFTSKSFCRVNFWNTSGHNELSGNSFEIKDVEKIIEIKP